MRFNITEADLPTKMRRFLADIDSGRAHCAPTLQKNRAGISSTLRCLVETAQINGMEKALNEITAGAMIERLEAANLPRNDVRSRWHLLLQKVEHFRAGIEVAFD